MIRISGGVDYFGPGEAGMRAGRARRGEGMGAPLVITHGNVRITHMGADDEGMGILPLLLVGAGALLLWKKADALFGGSSPLGDTADSINAYVEQLNRDLVMALDKVQPGLHPTWYSAFRTWRRQWQAYYAKRDYSRDTLAAYQKEGTDWINKANAAGQTEQGKAFAPVKTRVPYTPEQAREKREDSLPWYEKISPGTVFKLVAVGAVLFVAWPLVKGLRAGTSALGSRASEPRVAQNPRRRRLGQRRR